MTKQITSAGLVSLRQILQQWSDADISNIIAEGLTVIIGDSISITFSAKLIAENQLELKLKATENKPGHVALADIARFANPLLPDYLPSGVALFTDDVPLSVLTITCGLSEQGSISFDFTSNFEKKWEIITDLIALQRISLNLSVKYKWRREKLQSSFSGYMSGAIAIAGADFKVVIPFGGPYSWELNIIPADGNLLPGLGEFAELVGGDSLKETVKTGLDALHLGEISIDGVAIGFDLSSKTLNYVSMRSHVIVAGARMDVYVRLPDFQFSGTLAKGSSISFKSLVQHYFGDSDGFPEIEITNLSLSAYPGAKTYTIGVVLETDWDLAIGNGKSIALTGVAFDMEKSPDPVTGGISCSFAVADINLFLMAHRGDAGTGWEFSGGTSPSEEIPVGDLIDDLAGKFGVDKNLPAVLTDLTIDSLLVSFSTGTKAFKFSCEMEFPVNGKASTLELKIDIKKQGKTFEKQFSGRLAIGEHTFTVSFSTDVSSRTLAASYTGDLDFTAAINEITGQSLPSGIIPDVKNLVLLSEKEGGKEKGKKAMTIAGIGFAPVFFNDIPVIGDKLGNFKLGINKANLLYSNQLIPRAETQNLFVSSGSSIAESEVRTFLGNFSGKDIKKGLNVDVEFIADGSGVQPVSVSAPIGPQMDDSQESTPPASPPATQPPDKPLVKFGPISIDKIGLAFKDKKFWLNADASVDIGGLLLKVIGLGLGVNIFEIKEGVITEHTFGVDLRGVEISYNKGSVSIQGSFVKEALTDEDKKIIKLKVSGSLVFKVPAFGLVLIGQYTEFHSGDIALFCYGALIAPIPVPPTPIIITGIAIGFGFNYSFTLPLRIEEVDQCPLVQALDPAYSKPLSIERLSSYITPNIGQGFIAFGMSISVSKIVNATLLAVIQTSGKLQVLGKATVVVPPKVPADAAVGMVGIRVIGVMDPNEGLFIKGGLIDGSYILFSDFKLTGGFAFYVWFNGPRKGDFVFTVGGYHPRFALPSYYPQVDRLGFSLRLYDIITIKGGIYFALTSSAIMAGGALNANIQIGSSDGWFYVKINFLLEAHLIFSWSPYYYDAEMRVALSCAIGIKLLFFWVSISVSLRAELRIWGPEFSGKGQVTFENPIKDISFEVAFGGGDSAPAPLGWDSNGSQIGFKESFLHDDVISASVKEGLIDEVEASSTGKLSIVDCNDLVINIDTEIPITKTFAVMGVDDNNPYHENELVGIAPMDIQELQTAFNITMTKVGSTSQSHNNFTLKRISKGFPKALWGKGLERKPSLKSDHTTVSALGRIEIIPTPPAPPDRTQDIPTSNLRYAIEQAGNIVLGSFIDVEEDKTTEHARRGHISAAMKDADKVRQRKTILSEFGISTAEINGMANEAVMDEYLNRALVIAPRLKKAA